MIQLRNIVIADHVVPRKTVRLDVVSTCGSEPGRTLRQTLRTRPQPWRHRPYRRLRPERWETRPFDARHGAVLDRSGSFTILEICAPRQCYRDYQSKLGSSSEGNGALEDGAMVLHVAVRPLGDRDAGDDVQADEPVEGSTTIAPTGIFCDTLIEGCCGGRRIRVGAQPHRLETPSSFAICVRVYSLERRSELAERLGVAASTLYVHLLRPRSTITAGGRRSSFRSRTSIEFAKAGVMERDAISHAMLDGDRTVSGPATPRPSRLRHALRRPRASVLRCGMLASD